MDLVIFSALLVGIMQLIKVTFKISSRWVPLTTLAVTIVLYAIFVWADGTSVTREAIQNILIVALSAMGFWSGTKATLGR